MKTEVVETAINIVAEGTRIEGTIRFDRVSRVHGTLIGKVLAKEGSTVILGESSVVEGDLDVDTLMVDGYVHGNITARTKVVVSRTGRVVGNIRAPSLLIEFGAYFEGQCQMEGQGLTSSPSLKPA